MMESLYEKFGKSKVYIVVASMLIALAILTMAIFYQTKTSFSIEGQRYKYISSTYDEILFKDSYGNQVMALMESTLMMARII